MFFENGHAGQAEFGDLRWLNYRHQASCLTIKSLYPRSEIRQNFFKSYSKKTQPLNRYSFQGAPLSPCDLFSFAIFSKYYSTTINLVEFMSNKQLKNAMINKLFVGMSDAQFLFVATVEFIIRSGYPLWRRGFWD